MDAGNQPPEDKPTPLRRLATWARWLRRILLRRLPAEEAQKVREDVVENGALTERYILMCALSAGIATLGLLQSSTAVVIGAMLVSPLMAPIASMGFAFASLNARRAEEAGRVVGLGAGVGVVVGMTITWLSPIHNATPEIVARTAPTLLDLAIAVLSGLAGGYATVHRQGETAIGVAIATALMPPLATLGYSLAVGRFDFALGAGLLFMTNLAAISFCFALVARIRGVEQPFSWVKLKPLHALLAIAILLALVTPLALTLHRVTEEAIATQATRSAVAELLHVDRSRIAQIEVEGADGQSPRISATAVTNAFSHDAGEAIRRRLSARLHKPVRFTLQQIVASDPRAETEALVRSALSNLPDPHVDEAPIAAATAAARFHVLAAWPDPQRHAVHMLAAPRPQTSLAEFHAEEERLNSLGLGWSIELIPPFQDRLPITFEDNAATLDASRSFDLTAAIWALRRWGMHEATVEGVSGSNATVVARRLASARANAVAADLRASGLTISARVADRQSARAYARDPHFVRSAVILPFAAEASN